MASSIKAAVSVPDVTVIYTKADEMDSTQFVLPNWTD